MSNHSAVFSGGAGGARAPPEFGGSGKGRSLISAFWSLAISTNTHRFKKLNMALLSDNYPITPYPLKFCALSHFQVIFEKLQREL